MPRCWNPQCSQSSCLTWGERLSDCFHVVKSAISTPLRVRFKAARIYGPPDTSLRVRLKAARRWCAQFTSSL